MIMMILKSKFKILPIFLASYLTILPVMVVYLSATSPAAGIALPILFLLFVAFFWLTVFRTRAHKVNINENTIMVKRYFGLGKSKVYDFKMLDGFITMFETGKLGVSETIFVLEKGKRIGSISSFYHNNFENLKVSLNENLIDLGEVENSLKRESYLLFK